MTDKKDPGKFTIRFNICDPQHKAVIDLLNRQGRSKAQFLVSAVLHYINCKETPEVSVPVPNQAALEEMILAILAKNQSYLKKQPEPKPSTAQQDAAISAASEPRMVDNCLYNLHRSNREELRIRQRYQLHPDSFCACCPRRNWCSQMRQDSSKSLNQVIEG